MLSKPRILSLFLNSLKLEHSCKILYLEYHMLPFLAPVCDDDMVCSQYITSGLDICKQYPGWSKEHCPKVCGHCGKFESFQMQFRASYNIASSNVIFIIMTCV